MSLTMKGFFFLYFRSHPALLARQAALNGAAYRRLYHPSFPALTPWATIDAPLKQFVCPHFFFSLSLPHSLSHPAIVLRQRGPKLWDFQMVGLLSSIKRAFPGQFRIVLPTICYCVFGYNAANATRPCQIGGIVSNCFQSQREKEEGGDKRPREQGTREKGGKGTETI